MCNVYIVLEDVTLPFKPEVWNELNVNCFSEASCTKPIVYGREQDSL